MGVPEIAVLRYEDGTLVAVDDTTSAAAGQPGAVYEMRLDVREVLGSLEEIAADVGQKVAAIGAGLRQHVHRPDEVTIELGIALEGSGGLPVIARASGEVHLKVVATWRRDNGPGQAE